MDLDAAEAAIEAFLRALGAPVDSDPELRRTGRRVARTFADDFLAGYRMDPAEILASGSPATTPGLVLVTDLATTTVCPHHLLPATGRVHLGYLPGPRVTGFGALGRLVDCFSRRLMLQEELAQRIADALVAHLDARGAGAVVDLSPSCMTARGERRHGARAVTTAFAGLMTEDPAARAELLSALAIAGRTDERRRT